MRPRRDPEAGLVVDPAAFLNILCGFVKNRGLAGHVNWWREVVREFKDEHAFLDFSARRDGIGHHARVLIEFGVEHQGERHRVGFFDAYWSTIDEEFRQVVAVALDGELTDLWEFSAQMASYLTLPLVNTEVAELVTWKTA